MHSPLFDFFEVVAEQLCVVDSFVLTRPRRAWDREQGLLLDELKQEMNASSIEETVGLAVTALGDHFRGKGSVLPFKYDPRSGRFKARDVGFLSFVNTMKEIRSSGGTKARDFECGVAERLSQRATGSIHRVGDPRDVKKTREDFNAYLKTLGFDGPVLRGGRGDGGFDILWLLPIGTIPHRPMVSVQCKNGEFEDMESADHSVMAGERSFSKHGGLLEKIHVPCVLFNDYLYPERFTTKLNFVPLGLTDLTRMTKRISIELI